MLGVARQQVSNHRANRLGDPVEQPRRELREGSGSDWERRSSAQHLESQAPDGVQIAGDAGLGPTRRLRRPILPSRYVRVVVGMANRRRLLATRQALIHFVNAYVKH